MTLTIEFSNSIEENDNEMMEMQDQLAENFLSSELDFDLLNDLSLPSDFSILEQDIFMGGDGDDTNSLSGGSQSSFSEFGGPSATSSIGDSSPPRTPGSPFDSENSPALSPLSICPTIIKLEPDSDESSSNGTINLPFIINSSSKTATIQKMDPNVNIGNGITLPKSSRGRSASHDTPDVQAIKRHIRMIRNRESACLSRKKKKDYLNGLETKVKELETENSLLKQENSKLRLRLKQIGIHCGESITINNKVHQESNAGHPVPPMKKATATTTPPSRNNRKNPPVVTTVAKVALFGLCCFMFLNFQGPATPATPGSQNHRLGLGNSNFTSKSMINPTVHIPLTRGHEHKSLVDNEPEPPVLLRSRRSFRLWDNSVDADEVPRLNSYSQKNSTNASSHRHLNSSFTNTKNQEFFTDNEAHYPSYRNLTFSNSKAHGTGSNKTCHHYFNQTEAMKVRNDLKGIFNVNKPLKKKQPTKPLVYSLVDFGLGQGDNKGLAVYNEKMRQYSRVLDQLQRREDTFYVVSLDVENQLLLSAKAHNVTSRPRMTFVMPWKNETLGGKEELMQIDCEVTQVFKIKPWKKKGPQ